MFSRRTAPDVDGLDTAQVLWRSWRWAAHQVWTAWDVVLRTDDPEARERHTEALRIEERAALQLEQLLTGREPQALRLERLAGA
jgi:hypothetical protein